VQLIIKGRIEYTNIGRSMPIGVVRGLSDEFYRFAQRTSDLSGKKIVFADLRDHPEYSEKSELAPFIGCVDYLSLPTLIVVWLLPEACEEDTAVHELMHAWLFFARGYRNPLGLRGEHPFHVRMFAHRLGMIPQDLCVCFHMKQRGLNVGKQRDDCFQFLEDFAPLLYDHVRARDPWNHWQFAEQLGFLCAGADIFEFTDKNLRVLEYVESIFRHYAPEVLQLRDFIVKTAARTGYRTSESVGHFVEAVMKRMFEHAGLRFSPDLLECVSDTRPDDPKRATPVGGN